MNDDLAAALRLHRHIMQSHWNGRAVAGPDPIGRINWRITRFVRSYLVFIPWHDQHVFLQGQGYWMRSNLRLGALTGEASYLDIARQTADGVVEMQRPDGAWNYPDLRERRHLVCTVEGAWASLGLLAAYRQWEHSPYLDAARAWYAFQTKRIGFVPYKDGLAINFYDQPGRMVPNASTVTLWFAAELSHISGDDRYMEHADSMVRFLQHSQMENGEFQYHFQIRPHFMCYQYNAFQFLDLAHYYELTGDERIREMLTKSAAYLATGVTDRGSIRYNCSKEFPEVNYWTAALAAALRKAHELGLGDFLALSEKAYRYLNTRQRLDGGYDFSRRNYGVFHDSRSYPRYQAMMLCHLVFRAEASAIN